MPLPPPPPRWYARRSVQLGGLASVAAVVIGGYRWAQRTEPDRVWIIDITGARPGMGGGP